jgi:hypothetical protein
VLAVCGMGSDVCLNRGGAAFAEGGCRLRKGPDAGAGAGAGADAGAGAGAGADAGAGAGAVMTFFRRFSMPVSAYCEDATPAIMSDSLPICLFGVFFLIVGATFTGIITFWLDMILYNKII